MENLENIWSYAVTTDENLYGRLVSSSYADGIACFATERNYMCSYHFKLESTGFLRRITEFEKIKWVRYLPLTQILFAGTQFDMHVLYKDTFQSKFYFAMPRPVSELAWSPDEHMLAVTFDSDEIALYLFTGVSFVLQYSADLPTTITSSIYVGWGSEETQFQAPIPKPVIEECDKVQSFEPPKILWFQEGEFIAVNFHIGGKRYIKVFDKFLTPYYMTTEYINLGRSLSASPNGGLLASSASLRGQNKVVIFEKQCYFSQEFDVPENPGKIHQVEYHQNMEMLAVSSVDSGNRSYVNIYIRSNAEWYLKHQLQYQTHRIVRHIQWVYQGEETCTICKLVVFTSDNIEHHTFRFIINRHPGSSIVGVVRGNTVKFYRYGERIIPPPMVPMILTFTNPVTRVMFHPREFLAVIVDSRLDMHVVDLETFFIVLNTKNTGLRDYSWFHHVEWSPSVFKKIDLYICSYTEQYNPVTFIFQRTWLLVIHTLDTLRHYIVPYADTDSLMSYRILNEQTASTMYLTKTLIEIDGNQVEIDFSLTSNFDLYVNTRLLHRGVTSFLIKDVYMFFTTPTHLYGLRIHEDFHLSDEYLPLNDIYCRPIDTGARIVTITTGDDPQIVMTIPRGNLEIVTCTLMAIDAVEAALQRDDWGGALQIIRQSKLDWNLLIDLNPDRFRAHINDFMHAVENSNFFNNVQHALGPVDETSRAHLPKNVKPVADKDEILHLLLGALIEFNSIGNLVPIVNILQQHISSQAAVWAIQQVFSKGSEHESECKSALATLLLKDHAAFILRIAYSLHDVKFVRFIYINTAEDPAVYFPELRRLRDMDVTHRKFYMSDRASDFETALIYLMRCEQFDGEYIVGYIIEHGLQAFAYYNLPDTVRYYNIICQIYANELSKQKEYAEAGMVLKKANLLFSALEEYKKALDWSEVISIMGDLEFSEEEVNETLCELVDDLIAHHKIEDAVMLMENYVKDYNKAIEICIEAKCFKRALDVASNTGQLELIDERILPLLCGYMEELCENIKECKGNFEKFVERLKLVREIKKVSFDSGIFDESFPRDSSSIYTGASSSTSRTRSTTMSSRNRRKEERKKTDLREGGYYEDIALIRALYHMYVDVFSLGPEVREIGLIMMDKKADLTKSLHTTLSDLQEKMISEIPTVWPPELCTTPEQPDNYTRAVVHNKADLDSKYWVPPPDDIVNTNWKLEALSAVV